MQWRNPAYNEAGTIDCEINHPNYGWIPFTASPDDVEKHGRDLFESMKSRATPYVPPPPPSQEELDAAAAQQVRAERDRKLEQEVDPLVSNPLRWGDLSAEEQTAWIGYRQKLLDVPQQAGFPYEVTWPVKP